MVSSVQLTLYQLTNFSDRAEIITSTAYKLSMDQMIISVFNRGRKHCGEKRKCWLTVFSPFPTMFSKGLLRSSEIRTVWERYKTQDCMVDPFPNKPWFLRVCSYKSFENAVGKGEIARNEQFLLFLQCFLPIWRTFCYFHQL